MGKLFSGYTKQTTTNEPWKPQAGALKDIIGSAGDIYNKQKDTPFYQGPLYAGMDDYTRQGIDATASFAGGSNTGQMIRDGAAPLMSAAGYTPRALSGMFDLASGDTVGNNIAAASRYANDPNLQGVINAANRDTARDLFEGQLPEINRSASATGNINSSRAGAAEAIATRGANDRMADTSAAIRSDAFNRGLDRAESTRRANIGAMSDIASTGNASFGLGADAMGAGDDRTFRNLEALIRAGGINQEDRQGQIDSDFARWQGQDTRASDLLSRYYGIVGANNWGGTQTSNQKTGGNIFGKIAGAAATAASFASDIRLKTNIEHIGETADGLGVYEYDYLPIEGEIANYMPEGRQRGVMAHEVAELRPDALGPTIDGYMTVNYGAL